MQKKTKKDILDNNEKKTLYNQEFVLLFSTIIEKMLCNGVKTLTCDVCRKYIYA